MAKAEIEAVIEKYNLQMITIDLLINGKLAHHEVRMVPKVPMTANVVMVPNAS